MCGTLHTDSANSGFKISVLGRFKHFQNRGLAAKTFIYKESMLSCAQTLTIIEMPNKLIQSVLKFKAFNILSPSPLPNFNYSFDGLLILQSI